MSIYEFIVTKKFFRILQFFQHQECREQFYIYENCYFNLFFNFFYAHIYILTYIRFAFYNVFL